MPLYNVTLHTTVEAIKEVEIEAKDAEEASRIAGEQFENGELDDEFDDAEWEPTHDGVTHIDSVELIEPVVMTNEEVEAIGTRLKPYWNMAAIKTTMGPNGKVVYDEASLRAEWDRCWQQFLQAEVQGRT